jgi:hypothetical protein
MEIYGPVFIMVNGFLSIEHQLNKATKVGYFFKYMMFFSLKSMVNGDIHGKITQSG